MTRPEVLCLGELVWDCYPDRVFLGGAPVNVAVQLARHGVPAALLTAVGRDDLGRRALDFLRQERLTGARQHVRLPTGTVAVTLDPVGLPTFTIHDDGAWTDLAGATAGEPMPARPSVLVFGGLAMHTETNRRLLVGLLEHWDTSPQGRPSLLCDLNLRPGWSDPEVARWCLEHCHWLKLNEEEAGFLTRLEGLDIPGVLARYGLGGICTTLGPAGLAWQGPEGTGFTLPVWSPAQGAPKVVDTVGAGDALTAAMAAGLAAGETPEAFLERGRRWAAITCGVAGALPPR
jgi:fructokinase